MRRSIAIPIGAVLWLGFAGFMWATLLGVNLGAICGRVLAPWAYLAESIVFLPTLWLTLPLHAWLRMQRAGHLITVSSLIEVAALATLYSGIVYLLLRRRLVETMGRFTRRFGWAVGAAVLLMAVTSLWLRAQLRAADYGAPLVHQAARVKLTLRRPEKGPPIQLAGSRSFVIDDLGERTIIARDGAPPVSIAVRTTYEREPQFRSRSEYVVHRLHGHGAEPLAVLPTPGDIPPVGEPRCAHGDAAAVQVALEDGERWQLLSFDGTVLERGPAAMSSLQALRTDDGIVYVGFGGNVPGLRTERAHWLKMKTHARGGDLALIRSRGTEMELLGVVPAFSDHTLDNAAAAIAGDGVVHVIATEVAIPHDNSAIVHHLQFDPAARRWKGQDVLMVRARFTSSATPRIARAGSALEAFWHFDGGSDPGPDDGLYARRLGDPETWHLTATRCEFNILENADGRGGTLIGAATDPSGNGVLQWFYRNGPTWYDLGSIDAGQTLYTMTNSGTEPFALWRGAETGLVHAAFNSAGGTVVLDLRLPF